MHSSYYGRSTIVHGRAATALGLHSIYGCTSILRLHCDYAVRTATTNRLYCERGRSRSP